MIDRVGSALRANLIWLVVCAVAVAVSTLFSEDSINSVTANFMYTIGSLFGAFTLAKSAWIGRAEYDTVKWFVYVVAIGLVVLGLESFARGLSILYEQGDWYTRYMSAPLNIVKLGILAALLVVNASLQTRGREKVLAKTIAIGIGVGTLLYGVLFFAVRAIVV